MQKYIKSNKGKLEWLEAKDISKKVNTLVNLLQMDWVDINRVFCYRSNNSKAHAYARIWGFNRIWQQALGESPAYILEVLSEKFDKLSDKDKDRVLIHELTHIPRNFSGALVPHTKKRKGRL